ncbi:conserved hypothetical protein [Paenibacillus curdlanolyticus YK9]|uniref:Uncharacterized protein n=1 Tax=Paenibacillus curdlanolyticus YK9 TaxID=717606 RepID=E0I473_9BACL|nr:hypothetical protein [Paenibacillus curdlanolyticus]EFM13087.1 conserved hypothetical protein [Paenibacillus curdlanolyticus YK9]
MQLAPWGYIVLLGAFVLVIALALPRKKPVPEKTNQTQNMEIALEQFMENMESDNRELVELVKQNRIENTAQLQQREQRINDLEQRCADLETKLEQAAQFMVQQAASPVHPAQPSPGAAHDESAIAALDEEPPAAPPRPSIRSRYAELFEMYDQGKSVESVARKLGMNKGEVQLILQLAKQEEGARV